MVQAFHTNSLHLVNAGTAAQHNHLQPASAQIDADPFVDTFTVQLPQAEDEQLPEAEFWNQIETAWQICDRFDLQTEIWRGRILRTVRDREKQGGDGRGTGFLNWLKERDISKAQAYSLIELADSADTLLQADLLPPEAVNRFSKRAFIETAQAAPEVQQMVCDLVKEPQPANPRHNPKQITRREVQQLNEEWTTMSSELLPVTVKEKAANSTIPVRYLSPLVREMEKLPETHQSVLQAEVAANPDVETVKQATAEARYLAKYLGAAVQVQALNQNSLDLEAALAEALRVGCLSSTADLVNQAAQLEQTVAKLYTTWKRLNTLAERVYLDSGASTPNLRLLLDYLTPLTNEQLEVSLGDPDSNFARTIRLRLLPEELEGLDSDGLNASIDA
jgi:hypothetical protein